MWGKMREFKFIPNEDTPIVRALLVGPKRSIKARLILDSGAGRTQIRESTARSLGFTDAQRVATARLVGVEEEVVTGPIYNNKIVYVLGQRFEDVKIAAFPMKHLEKEGIDGLLGWDLIKKLHFELDGPLGVLRIF